jgi:hypothetical protein
LFTTLTHPALPVLPHDGITVIPGINERSRSSRPACKAAACNQPTQPARPLLRFTLYELESNIKRPERSIETKPFGRLCSLTNYYASSKISTRHTRHAVYSTRPRLAPQSGMFRACSSKLLLLSSSSLTLTRPAQPDMSADNGMYITLPFYDG